MLSVAHGIYYSTYLTQYVFSIFSPWGSSAPVTMTTTVPDDFAFTLGDSTDDGSAVPPMMNQSNPFNLSDLSSTLPPSLMPDNTAGGSNEVGGLYIETFEFLLLLE